MSDAFHLDRRTLLVAGAAASVAGPAFAAAAPVERFPIWPGRPPGGEGVTVRDEWVKRSPDGPADDIAWPHVATPMLTVVPAAKPNGAAVLVVPGGGYTRVAVGREGGSISRMFAARGITAFELLYRLPHDKWAAGPDAPLQDAQRAMRVIRARAAKWGIDPKRVAATGFSAGGHLTARLGSRAGVQTYTPIDAADSQSARPAVLGLFFPVITMRGADTHGPSKRELLGGNETPDWLERFSAEDRLPADMPPTFVAHAANDPSVKMGNSLIMFSALQAAKVPSELMVFEQGGHNLPLTEAGGRAHPWPDLFERFARNHGL